jgi:hypothetical protein
MINGKAAYESERGPSPLQGEAVQSRDARVAPSPGQKDRGGGDPRYSRDNGPLVSYRHRTTVQGFETTNGFDSNTRPGYIITETGFIPAQCSGAAGSPLDEWLRRLDPGLIHYPTAVQRA